MRTIKIQLIEGIVFTFMLYEGEIINILRGQPSGQDILDWLHDGQSRKSDFIN
jgi:hypothetical protein